MWYFSYVVVCVISAMLLFHVVCGISAMLLFHVVCGISAMLLSALFQLCCCSALYVVFQLYLLREQVFEQRIYIELKIGDWSFGLPKHGKTG
jgi:uncharacterized membrane protein